MSWENRLKESAYTSPSGTRIVFYYEDVKFEYDKIGSVYNFANTNGTYIQQMGNTGRRYPLRVFFWGSEYDTLASNFHTALEETGIGILEHPIYGTVNCMPFGSITQRDDLKTAANQAIIEVVFWKTDGIIFPSSEEDKYSSVLNSVENFTYSASKNYSDSISPVTAAKSPFIENDNISMLNKSKSGLESIYTYQNDINYAFITKSDSVLRSINEISYTPDVLAQQTLVALQVVSYAKVSIYEKINSFQTLINSIINTVDSVLTPTTDNKNEDKFRLNDLYTTGYLSCMVLSAINSDIETRVSALDSAEYIINNFDSINSWRDYNIVSLSVVDNGDAYVNIVDMISSVLSYLVSISFTLKREYRIVVDRNRSIIDLCAELFNDVDGKLDEIINTNALTGSEILEIPRGKEIVYYL